MYRRNYRSNPGHIQIVISARGTVTKKTSFGDDLVGHMSNKWDEVAGWKLNKKKKERKKKSICLPQSTKIFTLFKIAQNFFLQQRKSIAELSQTPYTLLSSPLLFG